MTDLADFLRARYKEIRQQAVAATTYASPTWTTPFSSTLDTGDDTINLGDREVAAHVILHDPAHVIADIDAKLAIVKLHGPVVLRGGPGAKYFDTTTVCRSCEPPKQFPEHAFPCPTLRLLASVYASHPDFRPEWAPDA